MYGLPVTAATAEKSFSKLETNKLYLRTTMSQEWLFGVSFLSFENEIPTENRVQLPSLYRSSGRGFQLEPETLV